MLSDCGASADVIIGARCQACPLAFVRDEAGRHAGVGQPIDQTEWNARDAAVAEIVRDARYKARVWRAVRVTGLPTRIREG